MAKGPWTINTKLYDEYGELLLEQEKMNQLAEDTEKYFAILDRLWEGTAPSDLNQRTQQFAADIRSLIDKGTLHSLTAAEAADFSSWFCGHAVFAEAALRMACELRISADFRQILLNELPYYETMAKYQLKAMKSSL